MKAAAAVCNIHAETENDTNIKEDSDLTAAPPLALLRPRPLASLERARL